MVGEGRAPPSWQELFTAVQHLIEQTTQVLEENRRLMDENIRLKKSVTDDGSIGQSLSGNAGPFSDNLMARDLPNNLILPTRLKVYDGTEDPQTFVRKFKSMMLVNRSTDQVLCRTFPTFLDEAALLWFSSLPTGSIHDFEGLSNAFINKFALSKIYTKNSDILGHIKQGHNESLREYLTRFNAEAMQIPDLDPAVELYTVKIGLRPGPFAENLAIHRPHTIYELHEKAVGYINAEEFDHKRFNSHFPDTSKRRKISQTKKDPIKFNSKGCKM